jgi:hypothetical protein
MILLPWRNEHSAPLMLFLYDRDFMERTGRWDADNQGRQQRRLPSQRGGTRYRLEVGASQGSGSVPGDVSGEIG